MLIKIDNREKELIKLFENSILPPEVSYSIETLNLGDIIIENEGNELVLFERKTLNDLASSIKDKRYIEQSMRLQHYKPFHNHNIIYLIEGCFKSFARALEQALTIDPRRQGDVASTKGQLD